MTTILKTKRPFARAIATDANGVTGNTFVVGSEPQAHTDDHWCWFPEVCRKQSSDVAEKYLQPFYWVM